MARPYIIALDHIEYRARNVLQKHARKRPLGALEIQHRFRPPQPLLSCRTVDVDTCGSRIYRSKSSTDIIEQQHRLIHEVYSKARTVSSAPARRKAAKHQDSGIRSSNTLSNIQVEGGRPCTAPGTAPNNLSVTPGLRTRPKTCGSPRRRKSEGLVWREADSQVDHSTEALRGINRLVQQQWGVEQHSLQNGEFVKGNKTSVPSNLDVKPGGQWLTFGGGLNDSQQAVVVDTFTGMEDQEMYYSIDGATGAAVAKQLRKGDRIRIGVNGKRSTASPKQLGSDSNRSRTKTKNTHQNTDQLFWKLDSEWDTVAEKLAPVPLCWDDQITRPTTKIIQPRDIQVAAPRLNLCESHPVIFKKIISDGPQKGGILKKKTQADYQGYRVKMTSKSRKPLNGYDSKCGRITTVQIEKESTEPDTSDITEDLVYEEILHEKLKDKLQNANSTDTMSLETLEYMSTVKEESKAGKTSPMLEDRTNSRPLDSANSESEAMKISSSKSAGVANAEVRPGVANAEVLPGGCVSRPVTSRTNVSLDHDLEGLVIDSTSLRSMSRRGSETRPQRVRSANRPTPAKPSLHETSRSSLNGRTSRGETEYIQIAQQLYVNKNIRGMEEKHHAYPPRETTSYSNAVIQSVIKHNHPEVTRKDVNNVTPLHICGVNKESASRNTADLVYIESTPAPANTPPTPRSLSPDARYAFDIPTADRVDSETNSVADPDEFNITNKKPRITHAQSHAKSLLEQK